MDLKASAFMVQKLYGEKKGSMHTKTYRASTIEKCTMRTDAKTVKTPTAIAFAHCTWQPPKKDAGAAARTICSTSLHALLSPETIIALRQ
jgi:hypothetical protein